MPEAFDDSVLDQAILTAGNEIGDLTMGYFGDFAKGQFTGKKDASKMIEETKKLLHAGTRIICEASFSYEGNFYTKVMGGSASIKAVLPATFPNDPELNYKSLGLIQTGDDAMNAFPRLHEKSPEEIEEIRAALLAYCRLETLAMVRIVERLYEITLF